MRPRGHGVPLLLLAAPSAQAYVWLVSYNNLWQYGTTVSAYLASVVEFDTWCWYYSTYDCVEWYTASVYGVLMQDGGTVASGYDYQSYNYPAGVYLYSEIPCGAGHFYEADGYHQAMWHGDFSDGGADDQTWTFIYVQSTCPPPSIYSMYPAEAERGTSGSLTINGQYLSYATGINVSGAGVSMYVSAILSDNPIEAGYSVASEATPGPRTVTVTTTSGTSNALTFNVTAPSGGGCGDWQKDALIAEYQNPQYQQTWVPACSDVIAPVGSAHFSAAEINQDNDYQASWTITRDSLLSGLECVRAAGGNQPMVLTGGYRNPASQMRINPDSPNSRHTRGDAADVGETNSYRRLQMKQNWGPACGACVEPLERTETWVHFDWRGSCPVGW